MRSSLTLLFALASLGIHAADGEHASSKVKLLAHIDLTQLSAKSGNTCWGYVSKSGREYGLMGCSNKTAIVDVMDPAKPKIVATIPHSDGLWSDIKVYKDTMYVSTENAGSGIQVVDLSKIDDGKATLIRTITTPGRSHTISLDADGPFLYTCGSNDGVPKGATTCFSLKDPNDPQRVGVPSLTPVYQHESQVVTYKTGKYKGRTIMFGGGEGRGLEIWDVTDKDKPSLVRRVAYPFVGYCHQGWLSADRHYFYVNDEFDESTNSIATRTLVFDVSDLDHADLVSTYTTSQASVDHNLYTRNDFVFHANYTSGLWIFDANDNPLAPRLCGFFDTYPADDKAHYDGAWSNYPLLPSGIVLVSDINDGLFIVDATEATKVPIKAISVKMEGMKGDMNVDTIGESDESAVTLSGSGSDTMVIEGKARWQEPSRLGFETKMKSGKAGVSGTVEFFNWKSGKYEMVGPIDVSTTSKEFSAYEKSPAKFIEGGTKKVRARVTIKSKGSWTATVDKAAFVANP